jgi:hypothetical protein
MIRGTKLATIVAALAATALFAVGGAGARIALAPAAAGAPAVHATAAHPIRAIDLESTQAIHRYLRSMHLDPRTFVIQRGSHNYAGPHCPGAGWNCTTSRHVVQIGMTATTRSLTAANQYTCTPGDSQVGPSNGTTSCAIMQSPASGAGTTNQSAQCSISANDSVALLCSIMQTNPTGGNNGASVSMTIGDSSGPSQIASEQANVSQTSSGRGNNSLTVAMSISLTTSDVAADKTQDQQAHQWLNISQDTQGGSGNNSASVNEKQMLVEKANGVAVAQTQDTNPVARDPMCPGGGQPDPNVCVNYQQLSGSGSNSMSLNQLQSLTQAAGGVDGSSVSQTQGCLSLVGGKDCGLAEGGDAFPTQGTAPPGSNKDAVGQTGAYKQTGPPGTSHVQDPRAGADGVDQEGGQNDSLTYNQNATLFQSGGSPTMQSHENDIDDFSDGKINTNSNITTNDNKSTIHCSGSGSCFYVQTCVEDSSEEVNSCTPSANITAGGDGGDGGFGFSLLRRQ